MCRKGPAALTSSADPSPQSTCTSTSPNRPSSKRKLSSAAVTEPISTGDNPVFSISRTKFWSTGTTVVVGATVVVDTTVVVGPQGSVTDGANTKPPSNTNGVTTTDIRPAEARTQRVTITPATNKNKPATTTNVEPPVAGKRHTSTANIPKIPHIFRRHHLSLGDSCRPKTYTIWETA